MPKAPSTSDFCLLNFSHLNDSWNWLEEFRCLLNKHYVKIVLFRNKYLLQLCVCFWFFWNECFPHLRNISDPKKMKLRENNVSGKIQTTKYDVCFLVSLLDRILDGKSGDDKLVWKINVIFRRLSEHLKIWYMLEIFPMSQVKIHLVLDFNYVTK